MNELLQHPAVQAGLAPLVVALCVGALLWRTRWAWLGVTAAYTTTLALGAGLGLTPLTAGRKVMLLVWLAAALGAVLDAGGRRTMRGVAPALSALGGLAAWWAFASLLSQRAGSALMLQAAGLWIFVAAHMAAWLALRDDAVAAGPAGVAAGLGVGVAALLSASIGYFMAGIAVAAGAGALVLLQLLRGEARTPGWTATLPLGLGLALFGAASTLLAQLPWFVLPVLALVPLLPWALRRTPLHAAGVRVRLLAAGGAALPAALLFVAVAWLAVRAASSLTPV